MQWLLREYIYVYIYIRYIHISHACTHACTSNVIILSTTVCFHVRSSTSKLDMKVTVSTHKMWDKKQQKPIWLNRSYPQQHKHKLSAFRSGRLSSGNLRYHNHGYTHSMIEVRVLIHTRIQYQVVAILSLSVSFAYWVQIITTATATATATKTMQHRPPSFAIVFVVPPLHLFIYAGKWLEQLDETKYHYTRSNLPLVVVTTLFVLLVPGLDCIVLNNTDTWLCWTGLCLSQVLVKYHIHSYQ